MCASIREAARLNRFPEPQVLPATMQEISIKKELANDLKKSVRTSTSSQRHCISALVL